MDTTEQVFICLAALAVAHGIVQLTTDVANSIQGALYYLKHEPEEEGDEYDLILSVWDYIPFMIGLAFLIINYIFGKQ